MCDVIFADEVRAIRRFDIVGVAGCPPAVHGFPIQGASTAGQAIVPPPPRVTHPVVQQPFLIIGRSGFLGSALKSVRFRLGVSSSPTMFSRVVAAAQKVASSGLKGSSEGRRAIQGHFECFTRASREENRNELYNGHTKEDRWHVLRGRPK